MARGGPRGNAETSKRSTPAFGRGGREPTGRRRCPRVALEDVGYDECPQGRRRNFPKDFTAEAVENLTVVVAENAGAQRGYLLMEKQEEWAVEAAYSPEQSGEANASSGESPAARLLISAVSQAAHTRTHVLIPDADRMREFVDDLLLVEQSPKSVLCLPLLNRGELLGVFYLENTLTIDAFRPDRLELLNTLATQAAISVQNAGSTLNSNRRKTWNRNCGPPGGSSVAFCRGTCPRWKVSSLGSPRNLRAS